jgi:uncharacterized protein YjbJ (UPF0337 family)
MSHDRHDSHDDPSSNEIRADIDHTRQAVGDKIDQLQARLDPSRLKAQAQETVQEMITDTANSVTDYVRTHRDDMVTSLADAARRNPLPTALVGLGVGWLILESIAGGKNREEWAYERRSYSPRRARSGYQGNYDRNLYGRDAYSPGEAEYSSEYFAGDYTDEYGNYTPSTYPVDAESQRRHAGNGKHHGNPLAKAAGAVKDTVSDVTGEIKERMSDAGQEIKDRVSDVKDRVGDRMGEAKDRMENRMENTMGIMRHQAGDMGDRGQRTLQRAGYQMEEWQARARYEGRRRGQQVIRNLEDNPLTYGALALAAGAALAILLPQTRTENRAFGEMRDQVMDKGQEVFDTAKDRAQSIASEMRPELEEKARKLVSDVKEAGKEIAQEAKDELRPVMDKAIDKTKQEARGAAQELGVDPDKLKAGMSTESPAQGSSSSGSSTGASTTGTSTVSSSTIASSMTPSSQSDKMVVNRDTLRGQWKQIKGEVKSKWGQLTDDELTRIEGDYEKLVGALQSRYGYERGRAEQEINNFFNNRKA